MILEGSNAGTYLAERGEQGRSERGRTDRADSWSDRHLPGRGLFGLALDRDTGFYTPQFSEWDALLLFGPLLYGIVPPVFRAVMGRKNAVRPFEAFGTAIFVVSALYFLTSFHFDMQYFASPLPEGSRFLIDWIDEEWARMFLAIGAIGGCAGVAWTSITYLKVRELIMGK